MDNRELSEMLKCTLKNECTPDEPIVMYHYWFINKEGIQSTGIRSEGAKKLLSIPRYAESVKEVKATKVVTIKFTRTLCKWCKNHTGKNMINPLSLEIVEVEYGQ